MLKASVYGSIAELEPTRWDAVPGDPFNTHAVLAALEGAGLPGVRLRYAVLEDAGGRWRAAAPLAHVRFDGMRLARGSFRRGIGQVRRLCPGFLQTSMMTVGTPLSVGNSPARLDPETDPRPLWVALAGLVREVADQAGAPWRGFKEFGDLETAGGLGELGWALVPSEPGFLLPIRWRSFEDYLASQRSAYRYEILKETRALRRAGIEVDAVPLSEAYDDRLHALYEAVVERAPIVFERLTPGFFIAFGRIHGAAAPLLRFRREGRVVGWAAMFFAGRTAYGLFHGIDYQENSRAALYYNILAAVIRLAIERGACCLALGQRAPSAKMRFGAIPRPLWVGLSHRNALVNAALRAARGPLFPAPTFPARRVFARPDSATPDGSAC